MNFSVGFQLYDNYEEPFSQIVKTYRQHISEVYFGWQDIPTGRSGIATQHGFTDWTAQSRMEEELRTIHSMGIKLDLLFNGNCYGREALSEKLANTVISTIAHIREATGGCEIVTTASPAIAYTVRKHFPDIEIRSSVNMRIGTVQGMQYIADLFDSFHVQREYNRNLPYLQELKEWADGTGKKLVMLANSGCFSNCSGQIFHDNLVAHEAEICEMHNIGDFVPYICHRALKNPENWHMILENTWIRPEDLFRYEDLFDTVKLATRMHALPGLVIGAYSRGYHIGNLLDLLEPGFGPTLAPYIINNTAFPEDWFLKTSSCNKKCHQCGYCREIYQQVLLHTEQG